MPKRSRSNGGYLSLDTETTGLDFHHGARPFLVTTCNEDHQVVWWEWGVNPLTRKVQASRDDLVEIQEAVGQAEWLVLQNPKFDVTGLDLLFQDYGMELRWPWEKVYCTLMAGHLLASNQPHDLTSMALVYLGVDIQPLEDAMEEAVKVAKKWAGVYRRWWKLAKEGQDGMPSAKSSDRGDPVWKYDCWLPKAVAIEENYSKDHPWRTVTSKYANGDSGSTLPLFLAQKKLIEERGLWKIYQSRMNLLPSILSMEQWGVTMSRGRTMEYQEQLSKTSTRLHQECLELADGEIEQLPVNGVSNALKHVIFEKFRLQSSKKTKKGNVSMDKFVLDDWIATLPEGKPLQFVKNLRGYRRRQTSLGYIKAYRKYWLPVPKTKNTMILYPSANPTATHTLRFNSENPNSQQISKQGIAEMTNTGEEVKRSARYMFGPAPGREWWSLDAKNLELRIPAYEAGEQAMIDLFEHPEREPYFGSYHLLIFDILHPDLFADHGKAVKDVYADTWYQWTKNGNFAVQYGAQESSGTADRAYHVPGAQARIQSHLRQIRKLSDYWVNHARKTGYVETMPDSSVDPNHGYPLWCIGLKYGPHISPTIPLSYHVQGTAMWWTCRAMERCHDYLSSLEGYHITLQVHDEIVFDFPQRYQEVNSKPVYGNLKIINKVTELMEQGGKDLGVPIAVSRSYHAHNWGEGVSVANAS